MLDSLKRFTESPLPASGTRNLVLLTLLVTSCGDDLPDEINETSTTGHVVTGTEAYPIPTPDVTSTGMLTADTISGTGLSTEGTTLDSGDSSIESESTDTDTTDIPTCAQDEVANGTENCLPILSNVDGHGCNDQCVVNQCPDGNVWDGAGVEDDLPGKVEEYCPFGGIQCEPSGRSGACFTCLEGNNLYGVPVFNGQTCGFLYECYEYEECMDAIDCLTGEPGGMFEDCIEPLNTPGSGYPIEFALAHNVVSSLAIVIDAEELCYESCDYGYFWEE